MKRICLIDMDGTIADFNTRFIQEWNKALEEHLSFWPHGKGPAGFSKFIRDTDRDDFFIKDASPSKFHLHEAWPNLMTEEDARYHMSQPGFFRSLPMIEGAKEALSAMLNSTLVEPFLCTAPVVGSPYCWQEKADWVAEHLGPEWVGRLIITRDKTVVSGDWLIDDKPFIHGVNPTPAWKHVLFDQPYNQYKMNAGGSPSGELSSIMYSHRSQYLFDSTVLSGWSPARITWKNWVDILLLPSKRV